MPRQLINLLVFVSFILGALQSSAQSDGTVQSLDLLAGRIQNVLFSLKDPSLSNPSRLQLISSQKAEIELELKGILKQEVRTVDNESLHDSAYEKVDELMLGLSALSILSLEEDGDLINPDSCREAQSYLRMISTAAGEVHPSPAQAPFAQLIRNLCPRSSI